MAMQWEAVARMMQFRAKRDAVDSGQLLIYVQAVDVPSLPCSRQEYLGMLDFPNYNTCGNRAGLLPLHIGMRVRLAAKLSGVPTKIPLVNEAVGEVVGFRFHPKEIRFARWGTYFSSRSLACASTAANSSAWSTGMTRP